MLSVLLLAVLALVFEFLRHGGQFRTRSPHFAGTCTAIPLNASAEDIQIDRQRGIAYLSYLDRRGKVEGREVAGTVMLLDLGSAEPRPRAALLADPPQFQPHGMSLYVPPNGPRKLFAINHAPGGGEEVVIFEEGPTGAFAAVETIRDPLLTHPNAIVAVGSRSFYVANDSGARNGFERMQELLFRRGLATVVYYDGSTMGVAARGLNAASGIASNPDYTRLYVAETSGNRLAIFRRDVIDGSLEPLETIDLGSAPDNVNVDADGTVWIAAHAKLLALVRHFANAANPAPTQVFAFRPEAEGDARLTEVYFEPGAQLSAGSVAAVTGQQMLLGSITDRKVLLCKLPVP